ncbi:MAG TPA: pyridoxal 5'-phosphate synthase glutaminase subunit PdxT [Solirubrobacteraceae bacterium]
MGVLALQGDFEAHGRILRGLGAEVCELRVPGDLDGIDALVIPGGESTTMTLGIDREGIADALRELCRRVPVLGTCAGMIMLDSEHLGVLDMLCLRNAFGRQVQSFEGDVALTGFAQPFHAIFIRAPWVAEHGPAVNVLAEVAGHPVAVESGDVTAVAFHPELQGDDRLHRRLLEQAACA